MKKTMVCGIHRSIGIDMKCKSKGRVQKVERQSEDRFEDKNKCKRKKK
jgi:hypothetical protein